MTNLFRAMPMSNMWCPSPKLHSIIYYIYNYICDLVCPIWTSQKLKDILYILWPEWFIPKDSDENIHTLRSIKSEMGWHQFQTFVEISFDFEEFPTQLFQPNDTLPLPTWQDMQSLRFFFVLHFVVDHKHRKLTEHNRAQRIPTSVHDIKGKKTLNKG